MNTASTLITLLATHLDVTQAPRENSVPILADVAAQYPNRPMLLAGDLNAQPDSPTMTALLDIWEPAQTETLHTFRADGPDRQIDYILTRRDEAWRVLEAMVLDEPVASDHLPIRAVLELTN